MVISSCSILSDIFCIALSVSAFCLVSSSCSNFLKEVLVLALFFSIILSMSSVVKLDTVLIVGVGDDGVVGFPVDVVDGDFVGENCLLVPALTISQ